ncbi:MAG: hypothetical protein NC389_17850 [Acetatifactor muris]|nr:hypothetical protein [Acetatifactor muris]
MSDHELLTAISDMLDVKLRPLKDNIPTLKNDVQTLNGQMQTLNDRFDKMENEVQQIRLTQKISAFD